MAHPSPRTTVMVCHDCCCGTQSKHPGADHDAQRADLLALRGDGLRVRVVDCLDECDRSNVVLVRDHTRPRRQRDTWLGEVLDADEVGAVADWVRGGCGPLPDVLRGHVFQHDVR